MSQHLREGSTVSITYESSPASFSGLGSGTVTNLTDAYIEVEVSSTKYAVPWSRIVLVTVTTD
jgi:hypothetical protein